MARTAKLVSAVFASVLAGIPLAAIPHSAAGATDNCLLEPRQDTPAGQHWYYRIEHGTGRHCWYLREEGARPPQSASVNAISPSATPDRRIDAATSPSIADARDEMPMPQAPRAQNAGAAALPPPPPPIVRNAPPADNMMAANAPDADGRQSLVTTRWPDPSNASSPVADNGPTTATATIGPVADATPAPQAAPPPTPVASATADAAPAAVSVPAPAKAKSADSMPPPAANSLQKLLIVILGALALAGLTASVVVRLGRARQRAAVRRRKEAIWESAGNLRRPPWVEPQIAPPSRGDFRQAPNFRQADDFRPVEDRRAFDPQPFDPHVADQPEVAEDSVERIEDFLARLTRQLQAELERSAGAG